jgi:hypothetical protein
VRRRAAAARAARLLRPLARCCPPCFRWEFTDSAFEGSAAIGTDKEAEWRRAAELVSDEQKGLLQAAPAWLPCCRRRVEKGEMRLFSGQIEAADLCQGAVGDCWLVL